MVINRYKKYIKFANHRTIVVGGNYISLPTYFSTVTQTPSLPVDGLFMIANQFFLNKRMAKILMPGLQYLDLKKCLR